MAAVQVVAVLAMVMARLAMLVRQDTPSVRLRRFLTPSVEPCAVLADERLIEALILRHAAHDGNVLGADALIRAVDVLTTFLTATILTGPLTFAATGAETVPRNVELHMPATRTTALEIADLTIRHATDRGVPTLMSMTTVTIPGPLAPIDAETVLQKAASCPTVVQTALQTSTTEAQLRIGHPNEAVVT